MATVAFKKGLLAALPSTYAEGTFYVTTDERAIYLDVDGSTRIRIGDFQEFATLQALQANTNPSTTALYYITELNVLAKWNGTSYVQINLDTGATSIEVVGDGNAVTAASYDPATRKITLTKGATYTTADDVDSAIGLAIGELGNKEGDTPYANVKDYVDTKIADVVAGSIEGLGALASKDKVAESDLEATLATKINGKANVGTADDTSDMDTLKGAKKYADEKAAAVQTEVDALEAKVGTVPESKTVVQMIEEAQEAATYDDTELAGRVTAVEGKVDTLVGADTGKSVRTIANEELAAQLIPEGAKDSLNTLQEIADWIQEHPDDASAMNTAITKLQAIVAGIGGEEDDYATVTAALEGKIAEALTGISEGATKVEESETNGNIKIDGVETTVYTHPAKAAAEAAFVKVGNDAQGHVVLGGAVTKADITALGIPAQDTTYSPAVANGANGLMTGTDKAKLDGMIVAEDTEVTEMLNEVFAD